jgi:hypothetical protein
VHLIKRKYKKMAHRWMSGSLHISPNYCVVISIFLRGNMSAEYKRIVFLIILVFSTEGFV